MPRIATRVYKLADTNLPGVTAIRWSKEAADATQSHSEAIASELLGPLDQSNLRVAALRRRLLSREWPDNARIVPRLVPQIGITHQLTPPQRVAETAFTSCVRQVLQNGWARAAVMFLCSAGSRFSVL